METITKQKAETPEARRWANKCIPGTYWDLDFCYYGPEKVVFPNSFSNWSSFIRDMPIREDDVWVISYPKCGTTWTCEMVWLLGNDLNFEEARKNYLEDRMPFLELYSFYRIPVPPKWNGSDETNKPATSMELVDRMDTTKPRFIKSHLPQSLLPKQLLIKKPKIIYVTRNPKDACVSYYHHNVLIPGYTGTMDDFAETFLTDNAIYSPYWSNVKGFYDVRHEPNILFLTYEEMKNNLRSVIEKTARFLGKEVTPDNLSKLEHHLSFEQMKLNPSVNWERTVAAARLVPALAATPMKTRFFRKGKVGSWKDEMSPEWVKKFDTWISLNGIPGLYS